MSACIRSVGSFWIHSSQMGKWTDMEAVICFSICVITYYTVGFSWAVICGYYGVLSFADKERAIFETVCGCK